MFMRQFPLAYLGSDIKNDLICNDLMFPITALWVL